VESICEFIILKVYCFFFFLKKKKKKNNKINFIYIKILIIKNYIYNLFINLYKLIIIK